jgi:hypothetical protein
MSGCPDVEALLQAGEHPSEAMEEHIAHCEGCAGLVALDAFRRLPDLPVSPEACDEALLLIAACSEGLLDAAGLTRLAPHLAACKSCRETLVETTLFGDEEDDLLEGLPAQEPANDREHEDPETDLAPVASQRAQVSSRKESPTWRVAALVSFAAVVAAAVAAATASWVAQKKEPPRPQQLERQPPAARAREIPTRREEPEPPPADTGPAP